MAILAFIDQLTTRITVTVHLTILTLGPLYKMFAVQERVKYNLVHCHRNPIFLPPYPLGATESVA